MKSGKRCMKILFCLFLFMIFTACSSSKKMTRPEPSASDIKDFEKMKEDLDPLSMDDYHIDLQGVDESQGGEIDLLGQTAETLQDTVGNGFRIQLLQTTDPEEAKNVQRDAILRFDAEIYRVFDAPYYKVRVGDFVNWRDAEKLQDLAIRKGYREAWIVRSKVNLKNAYKMMNEF